MWLLGETGGFSKLDLACEVFLGSIQYAINKYFLFCLVKLFKMFFFLIFVVVNCVLNLNTLFPFLLNFSK